MLTTDPDPISADKSEQAALHEMEKLLSSWMLLSRLAPAALPKLVQPDGESVELPFSIVQVLQQAVDQLIDGKAVHVTPYRDAIDIRDAAKYLDIQEPFLLELLESGEIPYLHIGTQRFVPLGCLLTYKLQTRERSEQAQTVAQQ